MGAPGPPGPPGMYSHDEMEFLGRFQTLNNVCVSIRIGASGLQGPPGIKGDRGNDGTKGEAVRSFCFCFTLIRESNSVNLKFQNNREKEARRAILDQLVYR